MLLVEPLHDDMDAVCIVSADPFNIQAGVLYGIELLERDCVKLNRNATWSATKYFLRRA
jgi:hypothetical protein